MEIKVGDKVRFLNDVGGGKVARIIDRLKVMVLNDDDFEVPVPMSELVLIEKAIDYNNAKELPGQKPAKKTDVEEITEFSAEEIFYPEITVVKENGDELRVFFAFVPAGRPGNSDIDAFLINDSNYNILYSVISQNEENKTRSEAVGVLEANTKEQIITVSMESVNNLPQYIFHLIFYRKGQFAYKEPISKTLQINPVKFYKENSFVKNDFFKKNALLFALVDDKAIEDSVDNITKADFKKIVNQKEIEEEKKVFKSSKVNQTEMLEVDLHIHELLDDFRGLTNSEMVEIQLQHFRQKLAEAMKNQVKRVVFIHGVGNGTLKIEIRKELDRMKNKLDYQDASFKEYGYGATMVKIF